MCIVFIYCMLLPVIHNLAVQIIAGCITFGRLTLKIYVNHNVK